MGFELCHRLLRRQLPSFVAKYAVLYLTQGVVFFDAEDLHRTLNWLALLRAVELSGRRLWTSKLPWRICLRTLLHTLRLELRSSCVFLLRNFFCSDSFFSASLKGVFLRNHHFI